MLLKHFIGHHTGDLYRQFYEFAQKVNPVFRTTEDRTYNVVVTRSMMNTYDFIEHLHDAYGWESCFNVKGVQINVFRDKMEYSSGIVIKSLVCKVDQLKFKAHIGTTDNKRIEEELIQPFYQVVMDFIDTYKKEYGLDHDGIYQVSPVQAV